MKKIIILCILIFTNIFCLTSCSPKANSLWCFSITKDNHFSFDYVAGEDTFDGQNRTFVVKDETKFVDFLVDLDDFDTKIEENEYMNESYIFLHDNEKYSCSKIDENKFELSCSSIHISDNNLNDICTIPFLPLKKKYVYLENHKINIKLNWDKLKEFYQGYDNITIFEEERIIEVPSYSKYKFLKLIKLQFNENYIMFEI